MEALPRFVVFQSVSNHKYLRLTDTESEGWRTGIMRFDGEEVVNPATKFELETAKSAEAKRLGLVHIRSCYNNKYLARDYRESLRCVAWAENPDENQDKDSCTLFKPEAHQSNYRFCHVHLGRFACLWSIGMYLGSKSPDKDDKCYLYTLANWDHLVFLPLRVAFKGDNGKYLRSRKIEGHPYHQFVENARDETAEYEVTTMGDGCVRIRSLWNGKFWRRSPNWIWADSSAKSSNNPDELFWPVKVSDNVVALRNMGNGYFCKRLTTEGKTDCLNAGTPSIASTAKLVVEEVVFSREIRNFDYRLSNARVYNDDLIALATGVAHNERHGTESETFTLKLMYKDIKTRTLSNNISLKLGTKTSIKAAAIPLIIDGKVGLSTEYTQGIQWGETRTLTTIVETPYTVTVPPRTSTTVTLKAVRAVCDVPFSYTQSDTLSNGDTVTKTMCDGVFKGANFFNFNFEEVIQKL